MNKLMENKKAVVSIAVAAFAVIIAIILMLSMGSGDKEEEIIRTEKPVLMCFISDEDDRAADTTKIISELQQEYSDRVIFTVTNTTKDPDAIQRYSLNALNPTGKPTPTYILLDIHGDFKDMKFGYTEKDVLVESIKEVIE